MSNRFKVSILLINLTLAWGLTTHSSLGRGIVPVSNSYGCKSRIRMVQSDQNEDFPPEDSGEYEGSIDWDSEWKKVVANEGKLEDGMSRPGKDFYKSEAEISAIKAANKAAMKATEVTNNVSNSLPQLNSFTGDWKFWIAILALVSVGISVLSAPQTTTIPDSSYYI